MDSINLTNSSCQEIPKIKKIYWQWYDNFLSVDPIKRYNEWRIKNIELSSLEVFKQFTFDVTEWTLDEPTSITQNGPIVQKVISGFNPKFNEVVESYLNEMNRRPVIICYETFDGKVYLFGGKNPKSRFSFKKAISGRQGYTVEFVNTSDESSLVVDDTDHFPAAPLDPDQAEQLVLFIPFKAGVLQSAEFEIKSYSAGNFTGVGSDGYSGTITWSTDSGATFGVFPASLSTGNTLIAKRTDSTLDGYASLIGSGS